MCVCVWCAYTYVNISVEDWGWLEVALQTLSCSFWNKISLWPWSPLTELDWPPREFFFFFTRIPLLWLSFSYVCSTDWIQVFMLVYQVFYWLSCLHRPVNNDFFLYIRMLANDESSKYEYFIHSVGVKVEARWFVFQISRQFLLATHHFLFNVDPGFISLASVPHSRTVCTFLPWNWKYRHLIITFNCLKL